MPLRKAYINEETSSGPWASLDSIVQLSAKKSKQAQISWPCQCGKTQTLQSRNIHIFVSAVHKTPLKRKEGQMAKHAQLTEILYLEKNE